MKAVFLDFDGVIVTATTKYHYPEKACVERLVKILKSFDDTLIVVSSTWRLLHDMGYIKNILHAYGVPKEYKIFKTPELISHSTNRDALVKLIIPFGRGAEINQWIAETDIPIDSFVVLDDDTFDLGTHKDRLVKTDTHKGLNNHDVEKAISILGRPIFCHPHHA